MAGSYWDKIHDAARIAPARAADDGGRGRGGRRGAGWSAAAAVSDDEKTPTSGTPAATTTAARRPKRARRSPADATPSAARRTSTRSTRTSPSRHRSGYFPRLYNVLVNFSALDSKLPLRRPVDRLRAAGRHRRTSSRFAPGVKVGPNELGVPERDARRQRRRDELRAHQVAAAVERLRLHRQVGGHADGVGGRRDVHDDDDGPYAYFRNRIGSAINTIVPKEALTDAVHRPAEAEGRRRRRRSCSRATPRARARRSTATRTTTARTRTTTTPQSRTSTASM